MTAQRREENIKDSPNSEMGSYATVSVTASHLHGTPNVRLSVFGRNIFDEEHLNGRFVNDLGAIDYAAQKSSYSVSLQWSF